MPEANEVQGIDRREAIRRVTALLGGVALAGGGTLCSAVERAHARAATVRQVGTFTAQDIALLDEVADTVGAIYLKNNETEQEQFCLSSSYRVH